MDDIARRVAAEHGGWFNLDGVWRCNCGEPLPSSANADMWMRAHIAEVTVSATRERIAQDIEGMPTRGAGNGALHPSSMRTRAARIAREGGR